MSGYIQVKDFGGKDRGLKFNQMAMEVFCKHIDMNAITASSAYATFYGGLIGNCYAKKEEVDFTFEQVVDWVDALYDRNRKEDIEAVDKCFSETQAYKRLLTELEDQKKKMENLT